MPSLNNKVPYEFDDDEIESNVVRTIKSKP